MNLIEKLKDIKQRVAEAARRSRFGNRNVTVMGASKAQSLNSIRAVAEYGLLDMGENYAQELIAKAPLCMDVGIRWHFIGNLQSNKIKHILPYVSSIDSVDSIELAEKIGRVRDQLEIKKPAIPIMIQVNLGNERQKAGLPPQVVEQLFPEFLKIDGVKVVGLMSIPPLHREPEKMRPFFKTLKELFDRLKEVHTEPALFQHLSMGMSNDFEVAIEEGATCIRVGEALFGPRPKQETA